MPVLNPTPVPSVIDKDDEIVEETVENAHPANTSVVVPKTRTEHFLAKIAGDPNAKELTPRTRREYFLNEIAENGGSGGGSGGGTEPVIVTLTPNTAGTAYTWSGATWEELINAFMHNVAGGKVLIDEITAEYLWFTFMEINPNGDGDIVCLVIGCLTPIGSLSLLPDGTAEIKSQ